LNLRPVIELVTHGDYPEKNAARSFPRIRQPVQGGTFLASLDDTHRFTGADYAVPTGRLCLVKTLVGDFEKRVVVSRIALAAGDPDADCHAIRVACVRICDPPADTLGPASRRHRH